MPLSWIDLYPRRCYKKKGHIRCIKCPLNYLQEYKMLQIINWIQHFLAAWTTKDNVWNGSLLIRITSSCAANLFQMSLLHPRIRGQRSHIIWTDMKFRRPLIYGKLLIPLWSQATAGRMPLLSFEILPKVQLHSKCEWDEARCLFFSWFFFSMGEKRRCCGIYGAVARTMLLNS